MMPATTAVLSDLYAPIREDLRAVERLFDTELHSNLAFVNELCASIRSYRGKMIRPALLLLVGKAIGEVTRAHGTAAAVVEMVHMATLVHDDVLDEAEERRGQPAVHHLAGNVAAVLLGDYLISHAYHLCSSLGDERVSRAIAATTNVVCEGELMQNHLRACTNVSEAEYLEIIRRKTGALTAVACELGARLGGADADVIASMREFGLRAGMAFQIVDDVLDFSGNAEAVGKTLGRDLALGKVTLPLIHALHLGGETMARRVRAVLEPASGVGAGDLRPLLEEAGSFDYARTMASECVAQARSQLEALPLSEARAGLAALAEFILRRQF